jgi:hypothetical protein
VQKATSPASILNCSLSKSIWSAIVVPVCNSIQWQRLNIGCGNEQAHLPWSFILCPEPKNPPGFRKFKKVEFHQTKDWVPFAMPRERRKQWSENDTCFVNSSKTMTHEKNRLCQFYRNLWKERLTYWRWHSAPTSCTEELAYLYGLWKRVSSWELIRSMAERLLMGTTFQASIWFIQNNCSCWAVWQVICIKLSRRDWTCILCFLHNR